MKVEIVISVVNFSCLQLGSVVCKMGKLVVSRKFTPKRIKQAFKEGIKEVSTSQIKHQKE